jgi:hypothetical protein
MNNNDDTALKLIDENIVLRQENEKLKEQIEMMKCRGNCSYDFEIKNNTYCPLYDFQNVKCPCNKWEMESEK